jgi:hypothetical protein
MDKSKDQDRGKGAMEQDQQNQGGSTSMPGQLGHRDEDEELKDADADLCGLDLLFSVVYYCEIPYH